MAGGCPGHHRILVFRVRAPCRKRAPPEAARSFAFLAPRNPPNGGTPGPARERKPLSHIPSVDDFAVCPSRARRSSCPPSTRSCMPWQRGEAPRVTGSAPDGELLKDLPMRVARTAPGSLDRFAEPRHARALFAFFACRFLEFLDALATACCVVGGWLLHVSNSVPWFRVAGVALLAASAGRASTTIHRFSCWRRLDRSAGMTDVANSLRNIVSLTGAGVVVVASLATILLTVSSRAARPACASTIAVKPPIHAPDRPCARRRMTGVARSTRARRMPSPPHASCLASLTSSRCAETGPGAEWHPVVAIAYATDDAPAITAHCRHSC